MVASSCSRDGLRGTPPPLADSRESTQGAGSGFSRAPRRDMLASMEAENRSGEMRRQAQDARYEQIVEARELAGRLRDRVDVATGGGSIGEPAEEIAALTDAVAWMAAETRAARLEEFDREAMQQETGHRLRRASDAPSGQTCTCGHERRWHGQEPGGIPGSGECEGRDCPCEKFVPPGG